MNTFKSASKKEWNSHGTVEHINAGSLQRIAEATEAMARRHTDLVDEKESLRKSREFLREQNAMLLRRINSLKGVITRMKKAKGK